MTPDTNTTSQTTPPSTPEKKGMGTGAKVGIGCGVGCLVFIIAAVILGIWGFKFGMKKVEEMTEEFRDMGFENVQQGQIIEVSEPVTEKKLYVAQMVKIMGDCSEDIAILAQACEIHGTMKGKVYFKGQVLTIQPKAVLKGGLHADAQVVQKYGIIEGEITGEHQLLEGSAQ
jgi:hypothetical protein